MKKETIGTKFWKRPAMDRRVFFRHTGAAVAGSFFLPGRTLERVLASLAGAAFLFLLPEGDFRTALLALAGLALGAGLLLLFRLRESTA